jgi:ferredoxin
MMALTGGNAVGNDASGVGNILGVSSGESASVNAVVLCGLVMFALVVVSAFFGKGRLWCNWVCPFGSLFSVLSKKSLLGDKICKGCENCRKCFPRNDKKGEAKTEKPGDEKELEVSRRTAIKGVAVLAAAHTVEKTTDGGVAAVSLPGIPERPATVLPPGAVSRDDFNLKCVGCGLCVTRCPMNVLRQSTGLKTFGQPEMYFQNGYCRLSCAYKCAAACPTGALIPRTETRANLHMGHAIWRKDLCLRTAEGDGKENCSACVRNCPVKALHFVDGAVAVDKAVCIGCGACEHVCPARPEPAVIVKGFDRQREVRPMEKGDLIAEMVAAVDSGWSCVIAKGGVVVARDKGRGIKPLLGFLDRGKLEGAIVADKIMAARPPPSASSAASRRFTPRS